MEAKVIRTQELRALSKVPGDHPLLRLASGALWVNAVVKAPAMPSVAEVHDSETDLYLVVEGEADVQLGGALVGARTIAPGQHRGEAVEGAEHHRIGAGDLVLIPAGTAHRVDVRNGHLTYAVIKVACR